MSFSSAAIVYSPETERTLAFGSITGAYTAVGTPLVNAAIQLVLQNQTDVAVSFSFDGISSAITLASMSVFTTDIQANRGTSETMMAHAGTQFYVRTAGAPSLGAVYISSFYANNRGNL